MAENVLGRRNAVRDAWLEGQTHAGLWHDRYAPVLRPKSDPELRDERDRYLLAAAKHLEQVCGRNLSDGYARAFAARVDMLHAHRGDVEGGRTFLYEAQTAGRMIVGLGGGAVLEHQITLEHTWGVPVIPGSALKGLASATAHRYGGARWKRAESGIPGGVDHQSLFGDTAHAGLVTFHDAWWDPKGSSKLPMDLDVMTVHHRGYYADGKSPPADTDEPNPVSFITAHGTYLIALTGPEAWAKCAAEWLQVALAREGIGAKTRAGYGRMSLDLGAPLVSPQEKATETLKVEASRASLTGEGIQRVIRAADSAWMLGVDLSVVRACIATYVGRDAHSFLPSWTVAGDRTEAEREVIARYQLPSRGAQPPLEVKWIAAKVCARQDNRRFAIATEAEGVKVEEQKDHAVKCEDGSIQMLKESPGVWFLAEVIVERGRKLKAIRGARRTG